MRVFLAVLTIGVLMPVAAMACSCPPISEATAKQAYANTQVIVRGRIDRVLGVWGTMTPSLWVEVTEVLKGENIPPTIIVNYNSNSVACGYEYEAGESDIFALYDMRDIGPTANNTNGYGYRLMQSCHGAEVKYFIEEILKEGQK
jgi:hypothetical protein